MTMTPRRINALYQLRARRRVGEHAELMQTIRTAMGADEQQFKRLAKRMDDEAQ